MNKTIKLTALLFAVTMASMAYQGHAQEGGNPWCLSGQKCSPDQTCPEPEPAPDCSKSTKQSCEAVKSPNYYRCNTGKASSCTKSEKKDDTCQSSGFSNECGLADDAYCEWDDDKGSCSMNGTCSKGPCNSPCAASDGGE